MVIHVITLLKVPRVRKARGCVVGSLALSAGSSDVVTVGACRRVRAPLPMGQGVPLVKWAYDIPPLPPCSEGICETAVYGQYPLDPRSCQAPAGEGANLGAYRVGLQGVGEAKL